MPEFLQQRMRHPAKINATSFIAAAVSVAALACAAGCTSPAPGGALVGTTGGDEPLDDDAPTSEPQEGTETDEELGDSSSGETTGAPLAGACDNVDDRATRERADHSVGDEMDLSVTEATTACTTTCFGSDQLEECVQECVVDATGGQLSEDCATCDARAAVCAVENCLGVCLADPTSPDCIACRCGVGETPDCVGDFETCAGVESRVCASLE